MNRPYLFISIDLQLSFVILRSWSACLVFKALDPRSRVWGSIIAALLMSKSPGKLWMHTASVQTVAMGTRWNENWYCVNGFTAAEN